jgi:hypothetical protein
MTGKYGSRRLPRSAGPEDVRPGWLLESAKRSIGPYVVYPDGSVADRRSGEVLWKPGDPGEPPRNPTPEAYDKPHTTRRGL